MTDDQGFDQRRDSSLRDDAALEQLLRNVGPRHEPPAATAKSIKAAVHLAWQGAVAEQRRGRQIRYFAVAASVAVVALLAVWAGGPRFTADQTLATISRVNGTAEREDAAGRDGWTNLVAGAVLKGGARVRTGPDGRLAVVLADGASLRLDSATRIAFLSPEHVRLTAGAVYLDSGPNARPGQHENLVVETPFGIARHLGTQYEVRLVDDDAMRVRVREGEVAVVTAVAADHTVKGIAGEELTVAANGTVERAAVSPTDADWAWVSQVSPTFLIDGRPLSEFLRWVSRETGMELVFASAAVELEAGQVRLAGTVDGLDPMAALRAVMATTRLEAIAEGGRLLVSRTAEQQPAGGLR